MLNHPYATKHNNDVIVPVFFPYALVKFLSSHGINQKVVLAGTGITPDSLRSLDTRIKHSEQMLLLSNAEHAWAKPGLGLEFGHSLNLNSLGMIGQAARASRTLGEAMDIVTKYLALRSPLLSFSVFKAAFGTEYILDGSCDLGDTERFMIEAGFAATASFLMELSSEQLNPIKFRFKRKADGEPELYTKILGNGVSFEQHNDSVLIPFRITEQKLSTSNQMNAEEARRYCDTEIEHLPNNSNFKQLVYVSLCSQLSNAPTETDTAKILGCSSRSLRRRLSDEKTSFRDMLNKARCDRGKRLLSTTHMSIEEIAHEIGYVNVGNFSRAFKEWTGLPPSLYRRQS